jgi:hypothetical protein
MDMITLSLSTNRLNAQTSRRPCPKQPQINLTKKRRIQVKIYFARLKFKSLNAYKAVIRMFYKS